MAEQSDAYQKTCKQLSTLMVKSMGYERSNEEKTSGVICACQHY